MSSLPERSRFRECTSVSSACPYHSQHNRIHEVQALTVVHRDSEIQVGSVTPQRKKKNPFISQEPLQSGFMGKVAPVVSSKPSHQHRRENQLSMKTLVCISHSRMNGLDDISLQLYQGRKDKKETHAKAKIPAMAALRQERQSNVFLCCFSVVSQLFLNIKL